MSCESVDLRPTPGTLYWVTGLAGAGKKTLAGALAAWLTREGRPVIVLDGGGLRKVLGGRPELVPALLELGEAGRGVREWSEGAAPVLGKAFRVEELNALPGVLARVAVRRWVVGRGVPAGEVEPAVVERVVRLAGDAAVPGVVNLPGAVRVRRRGGEVSVVQGK